MTIRNRVRWYIVSTRAKDDSARKKRKPRNRVKHRKQRRAKVRMRSHRR